MKALSWVIVRWPWTMPLANLERQLRGELQLRASCAVAGLPSPHQQPPSIFIAAALAAAAVAAWAAAR